MSGAAKPAELALVAICGYLSASPSYGTDAEMWADILARDVLPRLSSVQPALLPLKVSAADWVAAKGPRARRDALLRLRVETGAYFRWVAATRAEALRESGAAA